MGDSGRGKYMQTGVKCFLTALLALCSLASEAYSYNWEAALPNPENQRKDTLVLDYVPAEAHRLRLSILSYHLDYVTPSGNFRRSIEAGSAAVSTTARGMIVMARSRYPSLRQTQSAG